MKRENGERTKMERRKPLARKRERRETVRKIEDEGRIEKYKSESERG